MEEDSSNGSLDFCYDEESDSDLESQLYGYIHYMPIETETLNDVSIISEVSPSNTKNINDTATLDNNERNQENSYKCLDSERNMENSFRESFQQNENVIHNDLKNVTSKDSAEKVCNIDDPYTFDANVEDQNNISPMRKNRKKKSKKSKSHITNQIRKQLLNCVFKVPKKLRFNAKQSGISNISTTRSLSKELRERKIDQKNFFNKYKSSKESINQMYTEKYNELEEISTKYNVLNKKEKEKLHDIEHSNTRKKAENDSDSDESILEVPVPPKPPPPVINLNDSDEDNASSSKKNIMTKKPLSIEDCNTSTFRDQVKKALSKSQSQLTSLNNLEISDNANNMEDIILNCTDICKGASSITEIKEISKSVQKKKQSHCAKELSPNVLQDSKINNNKNKSGKKNFDSNSKQLDNEDKSYKEEKVVLEQNNTPASICSTKNIQNDAPEVIVLHTNVDFTEDILPVDEFIMSQKQSSPKKKRQHEGECALNDNVKRARTSDEFYQNEPSTSSEHSKKKENKDESDSSFFHPMSEKLKAFYTNSRGQENFDVDEVQSKMSKDPRLWAILDEDLITKSKRQKFWDLKCTRCHQSGHLRHDCTVPRKLSKCYMCGVQGHTETRCPRKMCLTCGKRQGTFRKTCETCRTLYCTMCNAVGHTYTECPDLWRRYHQTTTTDRISIPSNILGVMKPSDLLFCCNCTKRGHDSSMCKDYRWSQHFPTPSFVSNYTDGPTYINDKESVNIVQQTNDDGIQSQNKTNSEESNTNTLITVLASDDLLPFPKELLKRKQSQRKAFPRNLWEDETDIAYIIYECGNFYTIENNGMEITYTITARKGFNTYHIMECRVVPHFLENLLKLFMFEVKIYKKIGSVNEIILRIRTYADLINDLRRLILYWLSLDDDEKDYVMLLDLPSKRTDMLNLLNMKMKKLGTESGNALGLYDAINTSKLILHITRNEPKYLSVLSRIKENQRKLLLILNDHPNLRKFPEEIREFITILEHSKSTDVPLQAYLQILTVFNFVFVPHTPPKSFITKYGKYSKPNVNKNARKGNSNANASKGKTVQKNLPIPVVQGNRTSNNNNSRLRKSNQYNSILKESSSVNDFIHLENMNATYTRVKYDDTVNEINRTDENNTTENCRIPEYNNLPETAIIQSGWYNNNVAMDKDIMEHNLPSTSHDSVSRDTTSDKYTNITVNMSNKNEAEETADNLKLNMHNSKTDEYQNIDKCTNIIVSVSNKNQACTSNVENEKQQNNNKYTNITVSISNKDQASNISSNTNNSINDSCQSTEVNNSENKNMDNENDIVCIEINKNAQNQIEERSDNQDRKRNVIKTAKAAKAAERAAKKREKRRTRQKYDPTTQQLKKTTERCFKLRKLSDTIQQDLTLCLTDDLNYWTFFADRIQGMVKMCGVVHIKKALVVLKNKIAKQTVLRKNICMLQKLVNIELQHQEEIKSLYNRFDVVS